MLAFLFMAYIVLHALLRPEGMPPRGEVFGFVQKLRNSVYLLPVVLLIIAVLGSIYAGIATATEAAVLGVTGSLILSALQRSLTRASFVASLMGALRTSCMIALILAGADFLSLAMGDRKSVGAGKRGAVGVNLGGA